MKKQSNSSNYSHNKIGFIKKKTNAPLGAGASKSQYEKKYNDMIEKKSKLKRKKHSKLKKALIIALCIILSIIIVLLSVFTYLYYSGKGQFNNDKPVLSLPGNITSSDNGNIIEYKGHKYVYDENVNSILCIGVDKDDTTQIKTDIYGTAGQADSLYLICIDNEEKKYTVLSINRDSLIDIDIYDTDGKYLGVQKTQACISYAYGDGKEKSCENTSKAISRMLYNIPINSYFSINKASIPLLNDIIDGVDVPVYDKMGNATSEIKHLSGKEAYDYIHYRDTSKLDSNVQRIKRQTSYIKAFASKCVAKTKQKITTPLDIFDTVSLYSTTNLNASKITYLTTNAFSDRNDIKIDFMSVPGKVQMGDDGYAEYKVNNNKLLEIVLEIFYDELKPETK